jgi:Domain of unknown function (DUF6265)
MRGVMALPAVLFLSILSSASGPPLTRLPASPPTISDLSWLEGVWRGKIGGRDFEAHYTGVEGGQILSASKYSENGRPAGFEFERFEQQGDTLMLTPFPEGMSSVSFPLTEYDQKAKRAVFENLAHDFPTRISYQRAAGDRLTILVSGPGEDGKEQVLTYDLKRRK